MKVNTITRYESIHLTKEEFDFVNKLEEIVTNIVETSTPARLEDYKNVWYGLIECITTSDPKYDITIEGFYDNED